MARLKKKITKPLPQGQKLKKEGGRRVLVPKLSGAVGPKNLYLDLTYGPMNQHADVELIQYYFSELADVGFLPGGVRINAKTCLMRAAFAVSAWESDLFAAIRGFQAAAGIADADEVTYGIIRPGGPTLIQLADLAESALALQQLAERSTDPRDYLHRGGFDIETFVTEYKAEFGKDPHYHASKEPNLREFLGFLSRDALMIDIRWMAYILATVYREDVRPQTIEVVGKKGKPVKRSAWLVQWAPIEEVGKGKGRDYFRAVKVKQLKDGAVLVTEQDGDQWIVQSTGKYTSTGKNKKPVRGVPADLAQVSDVYTNDDGTAHSYYGRGYPQITWWDNYARVGAELGMGLQLLLNPEKALDPQTSYNMLSLCLRTGRGFANGRKLSDYMYGDKTDYVGARAMVNGRDHAGEIAASAARFEAILKKAKQ